MTVLKSGDLVVLKSGGPVMTVDTINTDIFDDEKVTGVFCAWFVGNKLERARFDPRALELASAQAAQGSVLEEKQSARAESEPSHEAAGEYKVVLDGMVAAMNDPAESSRVAPRAALKRSRPASAAKYETGTDASSLGESAS